MSDLMPRLVGVFQNSFVGPLIILMTVLYGLNFLIASCETKIGLVVANTLITNTYVWNLITSCFYEKYIWKLLFNVSWLFSIAQSIEISSWEQFGLFFLFSILACTIGTSVYCFIAFFASGKEEFLTRPIYGSNGVCMVILMFLRQRYRNERLYAKIPHITYHNAPILFLGYQIIMASIGFASQWSDLYFTIIALFFSWSYLRFYYRYAESEPLGDRTEDFSFVAMFPEQLHIILIPFTTAFYNIFSLIGVYPALEIPEKRTQYHHLRSAGAGDKIATVENSSAATALSVPVIAPIDLIAERRKAKAMKLLDAKMAELSKEPEGWDEISPADLESAVRVVSNSELNKLKI